MNLLPIIQTALPIFMGLILSLVIIYGFDNGYFGSENRKKIMKFETRIFYWMLKKRLIESDVE